MREIGKIVPFVGPPPFTTNKASDEACSFWTAGQTRRLSAPISKWWESLPRASHIALLRGAQVESRFRSVVPREVAERVSLVCSGGPRPARNLAAICWTTTGTSP